MDDNNRTDRRFRIELPVLVATVLDQHEAVIIDMSKQGLRLHGFTAQPRHRVIIEYAGDAVCGIVRWVKPDGTVGVRLDSPLSEGPLADVWNRFQTNVSAFGANRVARPQTGFGKKTS